MIRVPNNYESEVLSFVRQDENGKLFAIFNFCDETRVLRFSENLYTGKYADGLTGAEEEISEGEEVALQPWEWRVFVGV